MAEDTISNLVDYLDIIKKKFNLEQDKQLANKLGVSNELLSYIFSGRRSLSASLTQRIITALEVAPGSDEYNKILQLFFDSKLDAENKPKRRSTAGRRRNAAETDE